MSYGFRDKQHYVPISIIIHGGGQNLENLRFVRVLTAHRVQT